MMRIMCKGTKWPGYEKSTKRTKSSGYKTSKVPKVQHPHVVSQFHILYGTVLGSVQRTDMNQYIRITMTSLEHELTCKFAQFEKEKVNCW